MLRRVAWVFAAGTIIATASESQVCAGAPSFSAGRLRVGGGTAFGDTAKRYGVQLAGGSAQGAFGSVTLSTLHFHQISKYDYAIGNGKALSTSVGVPLNPSSSAQFCPLLGFRYQNANTDTHFGQVSSSARVVSLGGSMGGIASPEPGTDYLLFTSAAFVRSSNSEHYLDYSGSSTRGWIEITAGAGLMLNRVLTLMPAVNLWTAGLGGGASLSLAVTLNFGKSSQK